MTSIPTNSRRLVDFLTDTETSLLQRDYFAMRLEEEFKKAWRHGWNMALLFFDVDGLERIEQQEGAAAHASAILDIAGEILVASRDTDLSARLGPGRFAVALPGTGDVGADAFVNRVLRAIEQGGFGRLTLYVGGTATGPGIETCEAFVRQADGALAAAREQGPGAWVFHAASHDEAD